MFVTGAPPPAPARAFRLAPGLRGVSRGTPRAGGPEGARRVRGRGLRRGAEAVLGCGERGRPGVRPRPLCFPGIIKGRSKGLAAQVPPAARLPPQASDQGLWPAGQRTSITAAPGAAGGGRARRSAGVGGGDPSAPNPNRRAAGPRPRPKPTEETDPWAHPMPPSGPGRPWVSRNLDPSWRPPAEAEQIGENPSNFLAAQERTPRAVSAPSHPPWLPFLTLLCRLGPYLTRKRKMCSFLQGRAWGVGGNNIILMRLECAPGRRVWPFRHVVASLRSAASAARGRHLELRSGKAALSARPAATRAQPGARPWPLRAGHGQADRRGFVFARAPGHAAGGHSSEAAPQDGGRFWNVQAEHPNKNKRNEVLLGPGRRTVARNVLYKATPGSSHSELASPSAEDPGRGPAVRAAWTRDPRASRSGAGAGPSPPQAPRRSGARHPRRGRRTRARPQRPVALSSRRPPRPGPPGGGGGEKPPAPNPDRRLGAPASSLSVRRPPRRPVPPRPGPPTSPPPPRPAEVLRGLPPILSGCPPTRSPHLLYFNVKSDTFEPRARDGGGAGARGRESPAEAPSYPAWRRRTATSSPVLSATFAAEIAESQGVSPNRGLLAGVHVFTDASGVRGEDRRPGARASPVAREPPRTLASRSPEGEAPCGPRRGNAPEAGRARAGAGRQARARGGPGAPSPGPQLLPGQPENFSGRASGRPAGPGAVRKANSDSLPVGRESSGLVAREAHVLGRECAPRSLSLSLWGSGVCSKGGLTRVWKEPAGGRGVASPRGHGLLREPSLARSGQSPNAPASPFSGSPGHGGLGRRVSLWGRRLMGRSSRRAPPRTLLGAECGVLGLAAAPRRGDGGGRGGVCFPSCRREPGVEGSVSGGE
ncbi:collagen alpha-1(III) chain-like [Oryctolagus cuniculus]|uniref:collagen alpha-1(III) chain-like n=1 Tax=Oryctolagus cuniculus TaxID=9986 RepID=UPI003879918D